ncbi:MAG TPA: hypothetical protein VEP48_01380 [Methylomirabilota bacterium]|nr:hypothetical protein [Methylomirabilota bacterium]
MDEREIEAALAAAERELAADRSPDLAAMGFWRAVTAVKKRRDLVDNYAERIARIDRAVFRRRVSLLLPASVGVVLLSLAAAVGLVVLVVAPSLDHPLRDLAVLVGMGALLVATHDLAHLVTGALWGMHFTDWFIKPPMPQPGLKLDYASYLRATPRQRAWMHASGAIVSKIVPFAVVPYALAIGCDTWCVASLLAVGAASIVTDVLFSVRASDWKKFRREMKLAR